MESAGKRLRTRTDIGKDIERCLDDLKITHAELAEMLNVSDKTVDRMIGGKGPTTKYASALAKVTGKPESWFKENITWEECGKEEVTSVHFEAKNVTEEDKEFLEKVFAFVERMYKIQDKNLRNKLMENAEKNFEGSMELIELMNGKVS